MRYKKTLSLVMIVGFMIYGVANALTISLTAAKGSGTWVNYSSVPTGVSVSCSVSIPNYPIDKSGGNFKWHKSLTGSEGAVAIKGGQTKVFNVSFPAQCRNWKGKKSQKVNLFFNNDNRYGCWVSVTVDLLKNNTSKQTGCESPVDVNYSNNKVSIVLHPV